MMPQIKTFVTGALQVNCTLLYSPNHAQAVLVDPGGDIDVILSFVQKKKLNLVKILHTHAHFDHINGTHEFFARFPQSEVLTYLHPADNPIWQNFESSAALFNIHTEKRVLANAHCMLGDGQIINMPDFNLQVLHTPGHSPGSVCFFISDAEGKNKTPLLLSGDTLFAGSVGRSDLWGGSHSSLLKSIHEKIYILPEDTLVIPGHGTNTNVGEEKLSNPFTSLWA